MTDNLDLIDLNQFRLTQDLKKGVTIFEFYNGDRWISLTKQTGEFFTPKTLRDRFGGLNTTKNFLDLDETPPALKRSFKAATKPRARLPTNLKWKVYH